MIIEKVRARTHRTQKQSGNHSFHSFIHIFFTIRFHQESITRSVYLTHDCVLGL